MAYVEDTIALPTLTRFLTALQDEITASGVPQPCFVGILYGDQPAQEFVGAGSCSGQAFIRLASIYPSIQFPNPASGPTAFNSCGLPMVLAIEIGIWRFAPQWSMNGTVPPSVVDWAAASNLALADMALIKRAIQAGVTKEQDYFLGAYTPQGPDGDVLGGSWAITVGPNGLKDS